MITIVTYDWVPDAPRGFVRDLRARWALEEAGLPYRVESTPFKDRKAEHFAHQPFGQAPWLIDGDISIFESGAMLLHIGEASRGKLIPTDPRGRSDVLQWTFAALNSVEMASLPWWVLKVFTDGSDKHGPKFFGDWLAVRLTHMETVLSDREWLAGSFSIADILMSDVLRLVDKHEGLAKHPNCKAYVARAVARPAFRKAYDDQMAYFAKAD